MTVPNLLTFARLALTPAVACLAYASHTPGRAWALGLFLFAMATDVADGLIARLPGQSSRLGLYLDPVADKILLLTMFFVLADLEMIPLWMAILMMVRELLVGALRSTAATSGQVVGANAMGKTKALLQTICVTVALGARAVAMKPETARFWVTALTGGTLLLAWIFAAVFVWRNRSLLTASG